MGIYGLWSPRIPGENSKYHGYTTQLSLDFRGVGRFWSSSSGIASHVNQTKQQNQTNIMLFPHQEAKKTSVFQSRDHFVFPHQPKLDAPKKRNSQHFQKHPWISVPKSNGSHWNVFSCCISSRPRGGRLLRVNVKDHFFEKTSEDSEKSSKVALQKFAASSLLKRGF